MLDDRVNEIDDVAPLTQGHRVDTCGATNVQKSTRGRGEHSLEERQRSHVLQPCYVMHGELRDAGHGATPDGQRRRDVAFFAVDFLATAFDGRVAGVVGDARSAGWLLHSAWRLSSIADWSRNGRARSTICSLSRRC